jgi:PAS domain S-box-containing protein
MKTKTSNNGSLLEIDPGMNAPAELFRFMSESMTDGAVILDKNERITFANQSICRLSGFSKDELSCKEVRVFIDPAEHLSFDKTISDSGAKRSETFSTVLRSKAGEKIQVILTWNPYHNSEGDIAGHCILIKKMAQEKKGNGVSAEQEKNYMLLFENQGEGMGIVDKNEKFIFANPAAEQIFDVPAGDLVSRNLMEFIVPEQISQIFEETEKRSQLIRSNYETEIVTFSGLHKHLLVTATPQVDKEGKHNGTFAIFRDITELKKTQESLRQGELRYRTLFESAQDAIFIIHEEKFVDCNPATLRMFGCDKLEIINQSPDLFCPILQPDGQNSYEKIQKKITLALKGESRPFEYRHKQLKGSEFDAEIILTPIEVDSKPMLLAFVRDITERTQAEDALRRSEQKYRDLANLLPTAIYETDLNGKLVYANPTGIEWFGATEEQIQQGIQVLQFISPQHRQRAAETFLELMSNNITSASEYKAQKSNGEQFDVYITSRAILQDGKIVGLRGNIIDITGRKKAEETSLKLASIVESSDDAIIGKSLDGIISSWNKGAENLFGYSSHEILGKPVTILIPDDYREEEALFLEKIRNGEHIKHYETVRRKKDGNGVEISLTVSPIRDLTGEIIGAASIARDITERRITEKLRLAKEAAEALLKSEEKFSKAFHNSPVPICITTIHNPQIIEVNEAFEEQTGFTREELKDHPLTGLPIFNDPEDLRQIIHNLTTRGFVRNQEMTFFIKNGDKRICLLSSEVFELGGEPCALTVLLDITERRLAEKTIAESQQRFGLMIEQTLVGFVECDTNFIITSWNPSAERIFGYSAKEAIGHHVGNLIVKEEDRAERNNLWRDILSSESGISTTNKNETKDGRYITCEWHDTPIIDPNGRVIGIVSLVADVSERIEIEESLRSSREQLKQFAQHLQTVREEERVYISRELHDSLGQSLTGLKMFAFSIFNKLNSGVSGKDLESVRDQAKDVMSIIDDIMQQVRKIAKDLRPRILDEFGLIPAIESHLLEITKQTSMDYEFIKKVHTIELDPTHSIEVFRIFQEACTNIMRHANATRISVRFNLTRDSYILEVEDNGCGIKETDISKLKSLGLLGMKERSHVFAGDLQITGVEGKGTKVVLTFPKKTTKQ